MKDAKSNMDVGGVRSKRKKLKSRFDARPKNLRVHSDKLSSYKHGSALGSPMAQGTVDSHESPADREYRRLLGDSVYHGSSKKTPMSNKSKRRYA